MSNSIRSSYFNPDSTVYHFIPGSSISSVISRVKKFSGSDFGVMKDLLVPASHTFKTTKAAIKKAQEISDKYFPVVKGYRNSHTFKLACLMRDYGVSQDEALVYLVLRFVESDFMGTEIEDIVKSVYGV